MEYKGAFFSHIPPSYWKMALEFWVTIGYYIKQVVDWVFPPDHNYSFTFRRN